MIDIINAFSIIQVVFDDAYTINFSKKFVKIYTEIFKLFSHTQTYACTHTRTR